MFCPNCKENVNTMSTLVAYVGEDLNDITCASCGFKGTRREWETKKQDIERLDEIHEAIKRYIIDKKQVPNEWLEEYVALCK